MKIATAKTCYVLKQNLKFEIANDLNFENQKFDVVWLDFVCI